VLKAFISDISFIKDENRGQFEAVRASFDQLVQGNFSKNRAYRLEIPKILQMPFPSSKEICTLLMGNKYLGN